MAGNARGKLKEEVQGILSNYSWVIAHCDKAKGIIGDTHPELHKFFDTTKEQVEAMGVITASVLLKL